MMLKYPHVRSISYLQENNVQYTAYGLVTVSTCIKKKILVSYNSTEFNKKSNKTTVSI